jgi:hypothetical protein
LADKKQRRRELQQARKRTKAKEKAKTRNTRRQRGAGPSGLTVDQVAGWPTGDCYISESWHEQGPYVKAILSRTRDDGRVAAALFEIDLAERGVISAELHLDWTLGHLQQALAQTSQEEAMVTCEPELIARAVEEGAEWGRERGHQQAAGLERARELLGDLDPAASTHNLLLGTEPKAGKKAKSEGLFASLKKRLGV